MAVNYKPLNRQQDWTVQQKAALKKIFQAAEAAAVGGDSSLVNRTLVHTYLAGHFSGDDHHDIQALMKAIRDASDAADNARNIDSVVGSFRMNGNRKRVLRIMSNDVIAQIV